MGGVGNDLDMWYEYLNHVIMTIRDVNVYQRIVGVYLVKNWRWFFY